jgi:hypothetical protein
MQIRQRAERALVLRRVMRAQIVKPFKWDSGSLVDMFPTCNYHASMSKMIQLRHVPDALHRRLKARAALFGLPLSDYLIREVRKIAEQPTLEEMRERLLQRDPYRGKITPTDIVRGERDQR